MPNTPNFAPYSKRISENANSKRRNAHFYQKSYFKKLSEIMEEAGEEIKEEDPLMRRINRGSTLRAINEMGKRYTILYPSKIEGTRRNGHKIFDFPSIFN